MTRITFFHGAHDRLKSIAAWLSAPENRGKQVTVFTPDDELADRLDHVLWTHPPTGFVPHCRAETPLATETPVILARTLHHSSHDACLLNFSDRIPPGFDRFVELIEIISIDDSDRLPARERFRYYRDHGFPLENHNISDGL